MEVALPGLGALSRSPLPLRPLVEEERSRTPNHALETKFYGKVKSNSLIQAEPAEVHFSGFELGKKYWNTLQLINVSTEVMNIHVLPTQTKYFHTTITKKHRLVPGLAYTVRIQFCPDEWRYFYDCIRVHCKGEENLLIPVHAYPVIDDLHIPPRIDLPAAALQQSVSHAIPLRCSCPIDFEFQVCVIEPSQAFCVRPLAGVIPANGRVDVVVTFTPLQYGTAQVTFKLVISQFNSKPFLCTVTGTSNPYVALSQVERRLEHKDVPKAAAPASQAVTPSKTWTAKVPVKAKRVKEAAVSKPQMDIMTHGGVAKMMIRDMSKRNAKALKEETQSRQAKEAAFLKKVAENERKRQERCRQWQVDHVGEDPVCVEKRRDILEERELAWHLYMVKRGAVKEEKEVYFGKPILSNERHVLDVLQTPDITPRFQFHPSVNWALKRRCLDVFQQAAYKIVIRCRVNRRLACLRKLVKEMKERPSKLEHHEDGAAARCEQTSPHKVFVFSHPTFCEEDDPLVIPLHKALDLSPLPVAPNDWSVTANVPFFKLKVPQHYKLMGYKPVSTLEAYTSYIHTTLSRPLRPLPAEEKPEGSNEESYIFTAPEFKPVPAHPLRIFNPAPGLHAHLPPPKYLESDPEFHLCPLPTYHQHSCYDGSSITQDHLNDKEVIEDIMTWKKDFGTTLSDCLSKRRSQTLSTSVYKKEVLEVAYLKALPDELKHLKDKPPTESAVHLTPEIVRAEMMKLFKNEAPIPSSVELKKELKSRLNKRRVSNRHEDPPR